MSAIKNTFTLATPWQTMDPFLFCMHHHDDYPAGNEKSGPDASLAGRQIGQDFANVDGWNMYHGDTVPGFPAHPHRGFETITVVNEGLVDHADSLGAAGRYGGGDTQWMTAGAGVQHSEMFPLVHKDQTNPLELFQIWLNLPAANKMVKPHFAMLWREDIPIVKTSSEQDPAASVQIIAGSYAGKTAPKPPPASWASDAHNQVNIWVIKLEKNAHIELPAATAELNRVLYFYQGEQALVDEQSITANTGIELDAAQNVTLRAVNGPSEFLVLQGKPIAEPVVQYGPFVMNSEEEIRQTYSDFRQSQFGGWPWPATDQVHKEARSRFAKHADGTLEEKQG